MELTPIDTDPDPTEIYTILPLAGKGYGVIATQPIPSGTVIFQEPAYLKIPVPAISLTEKTLTTAFAAQSQESKDAILALHEGTAPDASSLMRIFKANNFGNSTSCWLHPRISRINHSCIPNAQIVSDECCLGDVAQVVAEKDIEPGDEITFSYNHELYEITTSRQRAVLLRKQYGFACDCEACDGNDEAFRQRSDARRLLIKKLREVLHGVETSDFSRSEKIDPLGRAMDDVTEDMFWMRESDLYRKRLPMWKKTAFTLLLAGLRDAEGLSATSIAGDYWHAAQYMLEQIQEMDDIVILPWAENVRSWIKKAIEVVERVYSPYDHDPQKLRAEWKAMQGKPCMQVAFAFVSQTQDKVVLFADIVVAERQTQGPH